ncbi:MAG TPA: hypothetical protein VG755_25015 [Nannocystaceae bacterium]|nr:hypothetical protein [Nannocystaceae bacterium]
MRTRALLFLPLSIACGDASPAGDAESFGPASTDDTAPATTSSAGGSDDSPATTSSASTTTSSATSNAESSEASDDGSSSADDSGDAPLPVHECESPQPEWVFCSDFEEGNKDIWDDYDGNPDETNLLVEDPGPFDNAGNHAMQFIVPAGRNGVDLVKELPGDVDRLYARWFIQWEPGFDFDAPNHGGGLHAGSRDWLGHSDTRPYGDDWYTGWIDYDSTLHRSYIYSYYAGMYMDCVDPQGQCWGDHLPCMVDEGENYCTNPDHRETVEPPQLETGRWYCIEIMLDGGTASADGAGATGALDFWVDGVEIGPWTDLWMRTTSELRPNILWLSLFHHEEHSVAGIRYDHVVVSTDRIGCGGS